MSDPCVYTFRTSETFSIMTLNADDLLIVGRNIPVLRKLSVS